MFDDAVARCASTLGRDHRAQLRDHATKTGVDLSGPYLQLCRVSATARYRLANALYARGATPPASRRDPGAEFDRPYRGLCRLRVAGYIAASVNYRLAAPEILYILKDSAPTVLIFDAEYADIVAQVARSAAGTCSTTSSSASDAPDWAEHYEAVLADSVGRRAAHPGAARRHRLSDLYQRHHRPAQGRHARPQGQVGFIRCKRSR